MAAADYYTYWKKINKIKGIFSILNKFVTFMSIFKVYKYKYM